MDNCLFLHCHYDKSIINMQYIKDFMQNNFQNEIKNAINQFWQTKKNQLAHSTDKSNRGTVVGGKQLDGFIDILKNLALSVGINESCIYTKNNYLPGYFRSSKDWDFIILTPSNKLLVAIELKSQVGSYGNNFNNRTEEALGSAIDFWTAFRKEQFPHQEAPWLGYMMIIGKDEKSTIPVKNYENHFPVREEFQGASYIERYKILCQKLIQERHYTSTALLWTNEKKDFGDVEESISLTFFLHSLYGYLIGPIHEFEH